MPNMTKRTSDSLSMDSATTVDVQLSSPTTTNRDAFDDSNDNNISNNNNNNLNQININSTDNSTKKIKFEAKSEDQNQNSGQTALQSPSLQAVNGQTKKSRVVHVRNIPADTCESDLVQLSSGFGRVTNCLILRGKSQAFVEFLDASSAQQMVNYWLQSQQSMATSGHPFVSAGSLQPSIRGRHVFCQLSNHKELKTNNNNNNNDNNIMTSSENGSSNTSSLITNTREPTCVLRVIVENLLYHVTLDVLHQVFSRAGKVQKIVTFTKNGSFQALVQYESAREAQTARAALDGQSLFHHANTLRIEFSKLQQLNVKYNNDKSRDFTNPTLPSMTSALQQQGGAPPSTQDHFGGSQESQRQLVDHQSAGHQSGGQSIGQTMFQMFSNPLNNPLSAAASASAHALRHLNPFSALNALNASHQSIAGQLAGLSTHPLGQLGGQLSHHLNGVGPGVHGAGGGLPLTSAVLLVSNLNESTTTTDALFTLFGVYGDVIRVKILFNKKDNALIQMAEPAQAHLAQTYLDKVKLQGRVIRVTPSKHQLVQMPKEGQHDAGLTKDFSQSSLHRFKKPGSKNYGNIYPPSATLHLSNIPQSVSEEDIRSAFQRETGSLAVNFKFFPKDRKMALIQLSSVDEAIQALIKMHNYQLSESSHLRVSFSKSSI